MELRVFMSARTLVLVLVGSMLATTGLAEMPSKDEAAKRQQLLQPLREDYYRCVDQDASIDSAIVRFDTLAQGHPWLDPVAQTYIGSLTALRATRVFWPQSKFRWANRGLAKLDSALVLADGDLEATFIHATTCYYLPFFFGRKDDARRGFETIAARLPGEAEQYDDSLVVRIQRFLDETGLLTDAEMAGLDELGKRIEQGEEEAVTDEE